MLRILRTVVRVALKAPALYAVSILLVSLQHNGVFGAKSVVQKCKHCKDISDKYHDALVKTSKSNFGGGNTNWEEKKLGSYATSETRLTEIIEEMYKIDNKEAHQLLEQHEELIEGYWFTQFPKQDRMDFFKWFCIDNIKVCCPPNTYGPSCSPCTGGKDRPCFGHGTCDGEGTRGGTGKCSCSIGYEDEFCNKCADGFYVESKNDTYVRCFKCHTACKNTCTSGSPKTCDECGLGWEPSEEHGCVDINECEGERNPCDGNYFCRNTRGWYECQRCELACDGCSGAGADKCYHCSKGHIMKDGSCIDIDECADGTICTGEHRKCVNTAGGYYCDCNEGYIEKDEKCVLKPKALHASGFSTPEVTMLNSLSMSDTNNLNSSISPTLPNENDDDFEEDESSDQESRDEL